jgi:hypothetical protein
MMIGIQPLMIGSQSSIIDLRSAMARPDSTTKNKRPGGVPGLHSVLGGRAAAVSSAAFSGDAALADERHLHDATF